MLEFRVARATLSVLFAGALCLSGLAAFAPVNPSAGDNRGVVSGQTFTMRPPPGGGGGRGPAGGGGAGQPGGKGGGGGGGDEGGGKGAIDPNATSRPTSRPKVKLVIRTFEATKAEADRSLNADDGVIIWQYYIDNAKDKLPEAKEELKVWIQRRNEKAERIFKKWVGGKELEALHKAFKEKYETALGQITGNQLLAGLKTMEEADKLYPNSYEAKFIIGYYQIWRFNPESPDMKSFRKGQDIFEQVLKLDPYSPEAYGNLGICLYFQRQYKPAIKAFHQAVKLESETELVKAQLANLLTCIDGCPPGVRLAQEVKTQVADANLMREQYKIGGANHFEVVRLRPRTQEAPPEDENKRKGILGSGSGEIVSADGYIITNKHVAGAGNTLLVRMNVGSPEEIQKTAEVVYIDDEQDLALIKIKSDTALPFLKYAKYDNPPNGRECFLLGYPLSFQIGNAIKITSGIVSAGVNGAALAEPDVTISAKANHGNSGGPIVDAYGNIIAVLSQGLGQGTGGDIYAAGISAGRVRKFIAKHSDVKGIDPGDPSPGDKKLDAEEIAAKCSSATVLIMIANQDKSGAAAGGGDGDDGKHPSGGENKPGAAGGGGAAPAAPAPGGE